MKLITIKNIFLMVFACIICTILIGSCKNKSEKTAVQHDHTETDGDVHSDIYTCPMHPQIIRDQPGACPICGMDLVKKGGQGKAIDHINLETLLKPTNGFVISSIPVTAISNNREEIEIEALGIAAYNTNYTGSISARTAGRIEKLYIKYNFQDVRKGQKVLDLYSPELLTAQQNLAFILKNDASNTSLIQAATQKLLLLGVPSAQVKQVASAGKVRFTIPVFSNYNGYISDREETGPANNMGSGLVSRELSIKEGMYVTKGQTLFKVYSPQHLWVLLNIYADQLNMVKKGQRVELKSETKPDQLIIGKVDYIEPFFRENTKTTTVRVNVNNPPMRIPIGSQLKGKINSYTDQADWLPLTAVVSLGIDQVVFLKSDGGFKVHGVKTGYKTNNKIQILKGLAAADSVATNAQFLMDSESFIRLK